MRTATQGRPLESRYSTRCPAALMRNPPATTNRGPKRLSSRANSGTVATTMIAAARTISGSVVVGHTVRNAASRKAFDATWCASMKPAVAMAMRMTVLALTLPRPVLSTSLDDQRFAKRLFESLAEVLDPPGKQQRHRQLHGAADLAPYGDREPARTSRFDLIRQ